MAETPHRILFVCTGNICRSPLAHRVLEHRAAERGVREKVQVESRGIGAWHVGEDTDPRMQETAMRHGINASHTAAQLSLRDLQDYDLIFAMDRSHLADLRRMAGRAPNAADLRPRIRMFRDYDPEVVQDLDVPDPYYGGIDGFENVFAMVDRTCAAILDSLFAPKAAPNASA